MTQYAVVRKSDQQEVYRYYADSPIEWAGMEFDTHDHIEVAEPVVDEQPAPAQSRWITKLAFRSRFTQAEKVAIEIASLDDPTATMQQRSMAAALRASQQDVAVATFIDLDRADTRAGVQMLETVGLIGTGRAAEILDAPVQDHEVYTA